MTSDYKPTIAFLSVPTIGDSLLLFIVAQNLQRNGFQVTYYSDYIHQLRNWLFNITTKPLPKIEHITTVLTNHDIVFCTSYFISKHNQKYQNIIKQHCIIIFMGQHDQYKQSLIKQQQYIATKIKDPAIQAKLSPLLNAGSKSFSAISKTLPLTDTITEYCRSILKLKKVSKDICLTPPLSLQHRKHKKRIMIHPTSGNINKNWSANKFIKLARILKTQGWKPVFCLAPNERVSWEKLLQNEFPIPLLPSLDELAIYLYETNYFIGNDSGIGHLASALGIPTLTIIRVTSKKNFRWRPGWTYGKVVKTPFKIKIKGRQFWQLFLSVNRVLKTFQELTIHDNITN
jgi:hypothetical protein